MNNFERRRRKARAVFRKLGPSIAVVSSIIALGVLADDQVYRHDFNVSASSVEYDNVASWATDPAMQPIINKALLDNVLTRGEYLQIVDVANDTQQKAAVQKIRDAEKTHE